MGKDLIEQNQVDKTERILLFGHAYRKSRFFATFLICAALLIAAFAVSAVWMSRERADWQGGDTGDADTEAPSDPAPSDTQAPTDERPDTGENGTILPTPEAPPAIPEGAIPVADGDLSASSLGAAYIQNETLYHPSVEELLERDLSSVVGEEPLVLILHTHASESYSAPDIAYLEGEIGDLTYSEDASRNVLAVGQTLCGTLNEKGITAIHCTVMHDALSFGSSYAKAYESIQFFLTHYPSIRYVIDLHRDSVLTSDGTYIRAVTETEEGKVAQVMAVVGSDGGGEVNPRWQENLALALQLRAALNDTTPALCRPISLRNETYNQELAPYSLLLEIGTGANSVEEAERAAVLVGEALAKLISGQ
ncbi:MAG: stage II sporulation protein P [Clostridia bacterium]|nr:stage II sporulation protein P [Clostridia bacterium]